MDDRMKGCDMIRFWICLVSILPALFLSASALAQVNKNAQPGANPPAQKPLVQKAPAQKPPVDPLSDPEATPKKLMGFIQYITRYMPQDEQMRQKGREMMLKAAEKMLTLKLTDDELNFAVEVKMRSLGTPKDITAFSEALKKQGRKKQSRMVYGYYLQLGMREALMSGKPALQQEHISTALEFLDEAPPQTSDLTLALAISQLADMQGDEDYILGVYRKLSTIFSNSKEKRIADIGKRYEGVARRLSLPGKKLILEGNDLSGEPFDFAKLQNKVVLIYFWSAGRKTGVTDLPKLKYLYEEYRKDAFEILAFSCDERREDVEKFVRDKEIPWPVIYGNMGPSPTIVYYGVANLPSMILMDKNGNVAVLNAHLDNLPEEIYTLLKVGGKKN
jgi:hypothetical protein